MTPIKIAILSFLFNWPSTGGGNVHTYELALFLGKAGYDVRHFYVSFPPWGIGGVQTLLRRQRVRVVTARRQGDHLPALH